MKNIVLIGLAFVSMIAYCDDNKQYMNCLIDNMNIRIKTLKIQIATSQKEFTSMTNDVGQVDRIVKSIKIPKSIRVSTTNRFSRTAYSVKTTERKLSLQDQRIMQFKKLIQNEKFCKLYEHYMNESITTVSESLEEELEQAKQSYENTLADLEDNDTSCNNELNKIDAERAAQVDKTNKKYDEDIKNAEFEYRQHRNRPGHSLSLCGECWRLKDKINNIRSAKQSFNSSITVAAYSDKRDSAIGTKSTKSAKRLANTDYENNKQTIFKEHYDRLIADFKNNIMSKALIIQNNIERDNKELKELIFLTAHVDMISPGFAKKYMNASLNKSLNTAFGMDMSEELAEEKRQHELKVAEEKRQKERKYAEEREQKERQNQRQNQIEDFNRMTEFQLKLEKVRNTKTNINIIKNENN